MKARTLADGSAVRNATASSTFSAKSASGRNTTSGKPNPRMDSVAGGGHGERRHEIDALLTVTRDLGRMVGVPTPSIDSVLGLARLKANSLGLLDRAA
jgi:2-dehydropantoate 2-reductase